MLFAILVALIGIAALLALIYERITRIMADTRAQLDAILAQVTTLTTQLATDVQALITAINNDQDFTTEVTQVQADLTALQNIDTSVTTETGTLGPTPPPSAPPA